MLPLGGRLSGVQAFQGSLYIVSGHWKFIARSRFVVASSVIESVLTVEKEKVGSAGGPVGLGHALVGIKQVGEAEIVFRRESLHFLGAVRGILVHVVGGDQIDRGSVLRKLVEIGREMIEQMDDEGAVVANEGNQAFSAVSRAQRYFRLVHAMGKAEWGSFRPER